MLQASKKSIVKSAKFHLPQRNRKCDTRTPFCPLYINKESFKSYPKTLCRTNYSSPEEGKLSLDARVDVRPRAAMHIWPAANDRAPKRRLSSGRVWLDCFSQHRHLLMYFRPCLASCLFLGMTVVEKF